MKKKKVVWGCSLVAGLALVCCVVTFLLAKSFVMGIFYGDTNKDKVRLQAMCVGYKVVPVAVEAHYKVHGEYPRVIEDLDRSLPNSESAVKIMLSDGGFVYSSDGSSFSLYKKLNWDGGIVFSSSDPRWLYSVNDEDEWPIFENN